MVTLEPLYHNCHSLTMTLSIDTDWCSALELDPTEDARRYEVGLLCLRPTTKKWTHLEGFSSGIGWGSPSLLPTLTASKVDVHNTSTL